MNIISENQFSIRLKERLQNVEVKSVVGKGRSGAIAAVYASHLLRIPFIPYGEKCPEHLYPILIIDTARKSGKTLRKAQKKYGSNSITVNLYDEPPRVRFWYEYIQN